MSAQIIPFPRKPSNDNHSDLPPQPGLRSFIIYDKVQDGYVAWQAQDESVFPHIDRGEIAMIDQNDREPMNGEIFLVRWASGRCALVEMRLRSGLFGTGANGAMQEDELWYAIALQRVISLPTMEESALTRWGDGPYRTGDMAAKIVGKVVGLIDLEMGQAA